MSGIYNIGTGISRSFKEIADILLFELGSDLDVEYIENPYIDYQTNTRADVKNTFKFLGFDNKFSLESGIKAYIPSIVQLFDSEAKKLKS